MPVHDVILSLFVKFVDMKQFISMILCQLFIHGLLAQTAGNADSLHQRLNQVSGSEQVEVLIKLSELHRNTMFADCIDYGRKAISLSQEIGASELEAQASKSMGISYYMAGKLDEALDFYLKSLAISESIRDTVGMANCTNNIGLVYEEWADFERAIKYYQRSFELEKELNNRGGMAISLIQMGNIHYYQQDLQEALDVFYQAMIH